jgi:hypothetical protein
MTLREWAILLKVARGEAAASCLELDALMTQGVINRNKAGAALTEHGRLALGLPLQQDAAALPLR